MRKKPKALCPDNVLHRQILPALRRCKTCGNAEAQHVEAEHDFRLDETFPKWRGWHAARRGLGSNLYALGVPEKVIQDILRHANVATTSTYYIKTVPSQVSDAMGKLQQALPETLSGNEWQQKPQTPRPPLPLTSAFAFRWSGGPGQSRTADQRFRKPLLYPSELRGRSLYFNQL